MSSTTHKMSPMEEPSVLDMEALKQAADNMKGLFMEGAVESLPASNPFGLIPGSSTNFGYSGYPPSALVPAKSQEQIDQDRIERDRALRDTVKKHIAVGATDDELEYFIQVCNKTGLDPLSRQIYAIKRYNKAAGGEVMSIQVSIDGFRTIAERSNKYAGQKGPDWCDEDGVWKDLWIPKKDGRKFPYAARVGVLRKDFQEPLWAVARWDDYRVIDSQGNLGNMWAKMPDVMLAKCAESLALRRAFPAELSGLYTTEEMAQAGTKPPMYVAQEDVIDTEVKELPDYGSQTRNTADDQARAWFIKEVQTLGIKNMPELLKLLGTEDLPKDETFNSLIKKAKSALDKSTKGQKK